MSDFMQGDKDNATVVPFSDDEVESSDEKELFAEDSPTASVEERVTRKKKQEERIRRLLTDGKQSKEEAARLKEEQAQLKNELAELRTRVMQPVQAPPPGDGKNPYERRLDAVYEKQQNAYLAAQAEIKAGTFTPEREKHYATIAREVESEKTRIHTEQALEASRHTMRAESAQQQWVSKYPEVYQNPRAYQFAEARFRAKQALLEPGQSPSNAMVDEAMNEAMVQFKLGPKRSSASVATERQRLTGVPSSGSGGSGSTGIQMTPEFRRMAIAAYSELPEPEALKRWVNTTGKRLKEKGIIK